MQKFDLRDIPNKILILRNLLEKFPEDQIENIFQSQFLSNPIMVLNEKLSNKEIDEIYMFKLFEFFLQSPELANGKGIKLTNNGWLNLKFCQTLYNLTPLSNELIDMGISKRIDENSTKFIEALHDIVLTAGIARKLKNHLIITKKGTKLKALNRINLLKYFIELLFDKYSWSHLDGHESDIAGQFGFLWILLNLKVLGDEPLEIGYYYQSYIQFFSGIENSPQTDGFFTPEQAFESAFTHRVFENILIWLNLIQFEGKQNLFERLNQKIQTTIIFNKMFLFNNSQSNYA